MSVKFTSNKGAFLSELQQAKRNALEICGGMAEGYAADLAPYDTGRLSNSISHRQVDEDTEAIFTNVEYAPYQELGTVKISAHPFMRPAIENHRQEYIAVIKDQLNLK